MRVSINKFALKIAICNSLGYSLSVGTPYYVDPILKASPWGMREYYLGYQAILILIIIFGLVYGANISTKLTANKKSAVTFCSLLLTWLLIPKFQPPSAL